MTHTQTQGADGAGTKTNPFGAPVYDPASDIATQVMNLPWARYGVDTPDALCDRHGEVQAIADKVTREAPSRAASRLAEECRANARAGYAPHLDRFFLKLATHLDATPAPAATPGVPDSLRALSEAADYAAERWTESVDTDDLSDRERYRLISQAKIERRRFEDACADHVRALIAAQPAGQAGDAEAIEATQITLGEGLVDITRIDHEGRTGVLFRPRKERIPFGEPGELPEGTYWPVKGDVVLWVSGEGPDVAIKALADLAPNSTRTGAAETERKPDELTETEIRGRAAALISAKGWKPGETLHFKAVLDLMTEHGMAVASNPPQDRCAHPACGCDADSVCGAALAARPEAPSDAGWSREDLEAFVAREWPEGRSAGAAARELVRALGVRGLAPTLQRLLTDLLGQINFASTDRAQILADFANAAPEAARMAKIDSFERWNPRVFDPTPPSDPAPSGQAEG